MIGSVNGPLPMSFKIIVIAYFDDAKTVEAFYATRKHNEADVKFCWK